MHGGARSCARCSITRRFASCRFAFRHSWFWEGCSSGAPVGWQPPGGPGPSRVDRTSASSLDFSKSGDMPRLRNRLSRFLTDSPPPCDRVLHSLSNFYREEFIRCQRCLDAQREYYSERTISDVERALTQAMSQLDQLCEQNKANQVVSHVLQQIDLVAGHSAWADPRQVN